jgi:hypothetical protein
MGRPSKGAITTGACLQVPISALYPHIKDETLQAARDRYLRLWSINRS